MLARSQPNSFFFFNDTATTEIYTLSLHDALPISVKSSGNGELITCSTVKLCAEAICGTSIAHTPGTRKDRKSTRLNSSHSQISYAVFCLKKKKETPPERPRSA